MAGFDRISCCFVKYSQTKFYFLMKTFWFTNDWKLHIFCIGIIIHILRQWSITCFSFCIRGINLARSNSIGIAEKTCENTKTLRLNKKYYILKIYSYLARLHVLHNLHGWSDKNLN